MTLRVLKIEGLFDKSAEINFLLDLTEPITDLPLANPIIPPHLDKSDQMM
jgi:hypothetical protein